MGWRLADARVRPRPPLLRALGASEPPNHIEIDGSPHRIVRVFKHDSWAATALYSGVSGLVVCKFHRQQAIARLPMAWLGRLLARRERAMLCRLSDLPNVPAISGQVTLTGKPIHHAVAHEYVPGHPLGASEQVDDDFFPRLEALLAEMHRRDLAYVDLHKRENILVGEDGQPYLIDFQIGFALADWWLARSLVGRALLTLLQRSDLYHLQKHIARLRPDQFSEAAISRPWWIRMHRLVAQPFRSLRRRFLVAARVRSGRGRVETEHFAEEGLRPSAAQLKSAA
jgi:hypothetical protein